MAELLQSAPNISCGYLKIEETCILLNSSRDSAVEFKYQSYECDKCDLVESKLILPHNLENLIIDFASFGTVWTVENEKNETICEKQYTLFEQKSTYSLNINKSGCYIENIELAGSQYIPLLIAALVYFILGCLWIGLCYFYRSKVWRQWMPNRDVMDVSELASACSSSSVNNSTYNADSNQKPGETKQRLRSLDTVRGIAIVVMIFVNYGGGSYWFFDHALWNGLTIADLVFPWFIWMMGMSMALSLRSLLRKAKSRKSIFFKILKRSIILFALGIMLNTYCTNVRLEELRISGVLQRFGVSYFVIATIHMFHAKAEETSETSSSHLQDIIHYAREWLIVLMILLLHILLTFFLHAPGCPMGYLGPGGLDDGGNYSLCTGGAAGYIDREILGVKHLYNAKRIKAIYSNTLPHDPEGILGYLTSIILVFLGLQAGKILLTYFTPKSRLQRWLGWFIALGLVALILCKASKNDGWIPINKNLWSLSFVCATGSLAFFLMSLCYYVIDVKNWWTGKPLFYCGMNPILLYVGHEVTHKMFPFQWQVASEHSYQLALNLWGTTLWVFIAIAAHHYNFFITV